MSERLRLWLERGERGHRLRDASTGELVRWEDPRIRVVPAAGVSYRIDGGEQAVSLWRVDGGLRVLIAPADAWIGAPR